MANFISVALLVAALICSFFLNVQCSHSNDKYKPVNPNPSDKKLAFMFLTRGPLPLEEIWHEFFRWRADPKHYTIYVHSQHYKYPKKSIFHNKSVRNPISVTWGNVTIALAIRVMIREALKDPLNEWFNVISEACLPLIPFNKWRNTLLSFDKSIIHACTSIGDNRGLERYSSTLLSIGITENTFRKSETWFSIKRKHADILGTRTSHMDNAFYPVPSAAEHFPATVLAYYGLDNETMCSPFYSFANWTDSHDSHPKLYTGDDIRPETFNMISGPSNWCVSSVICHFTLRKVSWTAKYPLLENLSLILNEEGQPYEGNPWDLLQYDYRFDSSSSSYYIVESDYLRKVPDEETARYNHYEASKAKPLTDEDMKQYRLGSPMISRKENQLYKYEGKDIHYIMRGGKRYKVKDAITIHTFSVSHNIEEAKTTDIQSVPLAGDYSVRPSSLVSVFDGPDPDSKKIAFLFSSSGVFPLEDTWLAFFSFNANSSHYSIYISSKFNYTSLSDSIFYQREVISKAHATVAQRDHDLISAALQDPDNAWFCFVREKSFPLVSFPTWRQALLSYRFSFINACPPKDHHKSSLNKIAHHLKSMGMNDTSSLRRSEPSFALIRKHAEIFASSADVDYQWSSIHNVEWIYIPTLLSLKNLEHETSCSDGFAFFEMSEENNPRRYSKSLVFNSSDFTSTDHTKIMLTKQAAAYTDLTCSGSPKVCHFMGRKYAPSTKFTLMSNYPNLWPDMPNNYNFWSSLNRKVRKCNNECYYVDEGVLRKIPDEESMGFYHFTCNSETVEECNSSRIGPPLPSLKTGTLYRSSSGVTYEVENGHLKETNTNGSASILDISDYDRDLILH